MLKTLKTILLYLRKQKKNPYNFSQIQIRNPQPFMFTDFITNSWQFIILYSPLGIIGTWRWSVWLWQKILSFRYRSFPENKMAFKLSLSIVTPVYNENPKIFLQALESWKRNEPDEIIAVIDASDTASIQTFETFARGSPNATLIVTEEPGKRPALARGARVAYGDIIALVDSDTLWDQNIRGALLAPFANAKIGGVAPRQTIIKANALANKLFSIRFDIRFFHEFPYLMTVGNVLTCLSGRTAVYRREALLPVLDDMVNEKFFGQQCISGEDKRLTSLIQKNGWHTYYQRNACVRTPGMNRFSAFWKQNLRWARNSWRTDLRTLFSAWVWKREPFFAYHLLDRAVSPFTFLLGPIYMGIAISLEHWLVVQILAGWWLVSRTVKMWPHLRRAPLDIFFVPFFILIQYPFAILKIYALFTFNHQGWITRWNSNRLRHWNFFQLLPARVGTFAVVFGMAFFISQYEFFLAKELEMKRLERKPMFVYTDDFSSFNLENRQATFEQERANHRFGTYVTRLGDTPALLARKYNFSAGTMSTIFPGFPSNTILVPGRKLTIPAKDLANNYDDPAALKPITFKPPRITYDAVTDTINVREKGSVVTIPSIAAALNRPFARQPSLLVETAPNEWLLRANLYISEGVTLIIDGKQVKWLKLLSTDQKYVRLRSYNGGILIRNTKITSWDETIGSPDTKYENGRAYVIAQANGRMDVLNSEIAYLGYPRVKEIQGPNPTGGVYGLSWKVPNNTIGKYLLTGNVIGNRIHNNYFGIYTFGTSGMVIRDNEIYENVQYGIDPHDDSNNLLIENNYVHNNGNHGIIVSKYVVYSTIRDNRSMNNRLHGIMLDRKSNYNLVENNISTGNVNGIAIYDSHFNLIRSNTFFGNRFGIRANMNSSENNFQSNSIRRNEKGVFFYGSAQKNLVQNNDIFDNNEGISLKDTQANFILENQRLTENITIIKADNQARVSNYIQTLPVK